jgi:Rieske Fe-S protein
LAVFTVIVLCIVIVTAFFASALFNPESQQPDPQSSIPISAIQVVTSRYLSSPPNFPNNPYKETKVFLENATLWSVQSTEDLPDNIDFTMPESMSFFIVNGTIKNDYTYAEIIAANNDGISKCTIGLDIYLYDSQGAFINTLHRGNPFRGCYEVSLRSRENANFETYFASPTDNVAYIEIFVSYLNPLTLY